ncbi:MAG: acetolactate synthase small subunit [Armatimonadota bacterium]
MKHTISVLVKNRPRVLTRVAGLFARRGFNIESLAVGTTHDETISRMTIVVGEDDAMVGQICKQVAKLHDVQEVLDHTGEKVVDRELCLLKVQVPRERRAEVLQIVEIFRADVVDVGNDVLILQVVGDSGKIDAFTNNLREFGITEMVRTGKVVLSRGVQPE